MKGRAKRQTCSFNRECPDGARSIPRARHGNMVPSPRRPRLFTSTLLRVFFWMHVCQFYREFASKAAKHFHFPTNTLAPAGHVPHVALLCAHVFWMVLPTVRDQTSPTCWHHHVPMFASMTTSRKWVSAIHWNMLHSIVDFITSW